MHKATSLCWSKQKHGTKMCWLQSPPMSFAYMTTTTHTDCIVPRCCLLAWLRESKGHKQGLLVGTKCCSCGHRGLVMAENSCYFQSRCMLVTWLQRPYSNCSFRNQQQVYFLKHCHIFKQIVRKWLLREDYLYWIRELTFYRFSEKHIPLRLRFCRFRMMVSRIVGTRFTYSSD